MSKLSKSLNVKNGSTIYQVPFYTTTAEASNYGTYGNAKVDGTECYYPLGTGTDIAHGSSVQTPLHVVKNNTIYYALTKGSAELATYTLTLAATSNQTITLKYKNRNITDSGYETEVTKTSTGSAQNFTVRKGTTWTATVAGLNGYDPGTLSASSGTVNTNTTVSASAASIPTYTITVTQPFGGSISVNGTVGTSFTVHKGDNITITTTTDEGFEFYGWTGI